jgi:hypothetical protein
MYKAISTVMGGGTLYRPDGSILVDLEDGEEARKIAAALNLADALAALGGDVAR